MTDSDDDPILTTPRQLVAMIIEDCETDAAKLDTTTFTPHGVGTVLGEMLAMIQALAYLVDDLLPDDDEPQHEKDSR